MAKLQRRTETVEAGCIGGRMQRDFHHALSAKHHVHDEDGGENPGHVGQ